MGKSKSKTSSSSDQYGYNVGGSSGSSSSASANNAPWLTDAWQGLYGDTTNFANNLWDQPDWGRGGHLLKQSVGPESLGMGSLQSGMQTAGNVAGFTPGMFTDANMSAYMNPYQQHVIDATMSDMDRQRQMQVMGAGDAAQAAGAFGGSRHGVAEAETNRGWNDIMARTAAGLHAAGYDQASQLAMGDLDRQLLGQNLNLDAAGILGHLGDAYQNMGMTGAGALQNLGLAPLNLRAGILSGTPGGLGGTSSSRSSQSAWNQGENFGTSRSTGTQRGGSDGLIGALGTVGGAAIMASDRRLKEEIEQVGVDDNTGLPLYEFQYIGQPEKRYRGVMADEVEDVMPEAVITGSDGYKRVNYDMLGISMQEV